MSRLSYDVTEKKLRRELEEFGPIKRLRIVTDQKGVRQLKHKALQPSGQAAQYLFSLLDQAGLQPACISHGICTCIENDNAVYAGKSRGYAFVEFESKKDMKEAYKAADGRKIEGRRVLIDVERGRTVENW